MGNDIRIFISYRRGETKGYAGWLGDCLEAEFGRPNVFRDVEKIGAGDWHKAIEKSIRVNDFVLCLMGDQWLSVVDERLRNESEDILRWEVALALKLKAAKQRVIPILLDGASMPDRQALPPDLQSLPRQNGQSIAYETWRGGLQALFSKIREVPLRRPRELLGRDIASRWDAGVDAPSYVGVQGGFPPRGKGSRLAELIESEGWEGKEFQVQFGGDRPENRNWGDVDDFLSAVGLQPYVADV